MELGAKKPMKATRGGLRDAAAAPRACIPS